MPKDTKALRGKTFLAICSFLFVLSYLLFMTFHFRWRGDGGIALLGAQRILRGELPYRDFFDFWMPGTFYLLAVLFRLFGQNLMVIRCLIFFTIGGLFLLVFLIAKKLNNSRTAAFLSIILFALPLPLFSYNHNWLGLLSACLAAHLLINPPKPGPTSTYWLCIGLINGLVINFIQWQGAGLFITCLLLLLPSRENRPSKVRFLLSFLGGAAFFPLLWCLFFWSKGALTNLVKATIFFPLTNYHRGNLHLPCQIWMTTTLFYILLWINVLKENPASNKALRPILLLGTTFHFLTLTSPTPGHTALSYAFTSPLSLYLFNSLRPYLFKSRYFPAPSFKALFLNSKFIKYTVGRILTILILFSFFARPTLNFIARMNYIITKENILLNTPKGSLMADSRWARTVQTIEQYLYAKNIPQNTTSIYIGPWSPGLYFIFSLQNPTRYAHLGPEHYTRAVLQTIISDLEEKKVSTIIFLPSETFAYQNKPNLLTKYLESNFKPVIYLKPQPQNPEPYPKDAIWERNN